MHVCVCVCVYIQLYTRIYINISININKCSFWKCICVCKFSFFYVGQMNIWDLHLLCVFSRQVASRASIVSGDHFYANFPKAVKDYYTFVASLKTDISNSFYNIPFKPAVTPLLFKVYPGYIGKSSFNTVVDIHDQHSGELYVKNVNQLVCVNKLSRKPTNLPQWFRDKYANLNKGSSLIVPKLIKPSDDIPTHTCHIRVPYSDIDLYKHTNFSAYLKYSIEAAMEASNRGIYRELFSGVLMKFRVKSVKTAFIGEAIAENMLSVTTWQDSENQQQIYCDITHQGTKKSICQTAIEFYENTDDGAYLDQ